VESVLANSAATILSRGKINTLNSIASERTIIGFGVVGTARLGTTTSNRPLFWGGTGTDLFAHTDVNQKIAENYSFVGAYSDTGKAVSEAGDTVKTDAVVLQPRAFIYIGVMGGGSRNIYGLFKTIAAAPVRLPDAQLVALSGGT
jgi:hypothetical protein